MIQDLPRWSRKFILTSGDRYHTLSAEQATFNDYSRKVTHEKITLFDHLSDGL
jgi:hypothetical protein